jgi:class 3 adenylate cyclase
MLEDKTGFLASPATTALPEATRKRMAAFDTTILLQPVDTESVRQALQGRVGTAEFIDFQGQEVLGSFAPLDIPDLNWILVVKRSTAELFAGLDTFARRVMIATLLLALAIPLLATLLARQFLKPLNALLAGIERLRAGEKEVAVAAHGSDEFSELTSAFNTMASTIRERDETIQAKSSAYEALLKHIFPDVVAERLKYGEGQMFESIPQTTVAFVSIYGFVQAMQDSDGDGERSFKLLNEIVDAFDSIADENGVEKVKTIGEHYLAACGLSIPRLDHAQRMIEFADEIAAELERVNYAHGLSLSLRIGVDSGLVHAGLVGNRRFVYDIWGRPPNVARRMVSEASLNEIRLSEATFQELGSPADFEAREPFQSTTLGSVQTYGRTLATASGQKSKRSQTTDPKAAE